MRRAAAAILTVVATALLPVLAVAHAAPTEPWPAWSTPQGGIMRHAETRLGEWVYTNTLWLAQGANADRLERDQYYADFAPDDPGQISGDLRRALTYEFFGTGRSVTNGDHELPSDRKSWPDGTGEIAELRLRTDADELFIRVGWHSFPSPDAQIATVTFGGEAGAAARQWPANARLTAPWEAALTISGRGAVLEGPAGAPVTVASRVVDHAVEVRVPLNLLPTGRRLVVRGGGGLADPAAPDTYWQVPPGSAAAARPGSGGLTSPTNVWSLLFADDDPWGFDELSQSRLLTAGDATPASAVVDLDLLAGGGSSTDTVTGDLSRIYRSRYDFGDGIARAPGVGGTPAPPPGVPLGADFNVTYTRTGRLQDYAMRVPAAYTASRQWPLIVYLHGFGGTPEEPFRLPLGLVDEAEDRGYLFASLQGRGDLFYRPGLGELDVVEALADVRRRYAVDADRIYLMGHSMGGYGTNNIAVRLPDVFAAVAPAQGTDSVALAPNLRHVPWLMVTSDFDLDPGGEAAEAHYAALSELGYDATLLRYRLKTHEYSSIYDNLPRLFEHFGAHRRVVDPATITWVAPGGAKPELGLVHDGAYWLSGVREGQVTVQSLALPPDRDPAQATREVVDPSDEGGPTGRTIAILRTTRPGGGLLRARRNVLEVQAIGTASLAVDISRAGLVADGLAICPRNETGFRIGLSGAADGRYEHLAAGVRVADVIVAGERGSLDVASAGCSRLRRLGRAAPGPTPLPATGGLSALALAALLTAGAATTARRRRTCR